MDHDFNSNSSFTSGISKQFDDLFGGRGSDLGIKVFSEFSQVFLSGIDNRVDTFSNALDNQDFRQFQLLAHQLRGSFRTLGAHPLADALQKIEDHCKNNADPNVQLLKEWRDVVIQGAPQLVSDLRLFMGSLQSAS